jgi:adhesin transport system outer membrane protein
MQTRSIASLSAGVVVHVVVLTVSLCAVGANVSSAHADKLHEVVREALESNPELGAIRSNRRAIDQELRAARGLGLPTLDLKSNVGAHRDSYRSGLGIKDTDDWRFHRDVSVIMSQRLFDGFERTHEVARQKNRVESARWRVADTANSIALRAVQAYFEVQRSAAVVAAAKSNLSSLAALQSRILARVRGGYGDDAEETEAGSRTANARAVMIEAQARHEDAQSLFRSVVGRSPGRLAAAGIPKRGLPRTVVAAVAEARRAAPSVIATEHDVVAAKASVGSAYSRLYPKLNLELSSYYGRHTEEQDDRDLDHRAMLVVRWNLFNGGINRARIYESRERASEAEEIAANTRRIVERETRNSWTAMRAAAERAPALRRQLDLSRRTRATYADQFFTGGRRLLDLLDAQTEVFVAESTLYNEQFVGKFNAYRVLAAMGRLVWALGEDLPEEAVRAHRKSILDAWKVRVSPHHNAKREGYK